jgi:tetratricopeptide (TPR) repeat protein
MTGLIARIRRWASPTRGTHRADTSRRTRRAGRRLAGAIDRAAGKGRPDVAARLARRGALLCRRSAPLAESIARLALAEGDPETAVSVIEGCRVRPRPDSLRLLRATCLHMSGDGREAQRDLHRWSRNRRAPLEARLLLGLLEWRQGDLDRAAETLARNLRRGDDPQTVAALTLLSVARGRARLARQWSGRLRAALESGGPPGAPDDREHLELLLESLGMRGATSRPRHSAEDVERLATELCAAPQSIETLVEAQRLRTDPATIALLEAAISRAVPELDDRGAARGGLAQLALLRGDRTEALRHARRGLEDNPMSVALARLVEELSSAPGHESDDEPAAPGPVIATIGPQEPPSRERAA